GSPTSAWSTTPTKPGSRSPAARSASSRGFLRERHRLADPPCPDGLDRPTVVRPRRSTAQSGRPGRRPDPRPGARRRAACRCPRPHEPSPPRAIDRCGDRPRRRSRAACPSVAPMTTAPGVVGSTALAELAASIRPLDDGAMQAARERLDRLTKPPGSLGRLETLAVQLAGIRARLVTAVERPAIVVFAGDHGVTRQGVSPYPSDVTRQMVANFVAGGAA